MRRFAAVVLASVFVSAPISAQDAPVTTQRGRASIRGKITDWSGAPLPRAVVRVKYADIRLARASLSDLGGQYTLSGLTPGHVKVTVECPNFATIIREIEITPDREDYAFDFTLQLKSERYRGGVSGIPGPAEIAAVEAERRLQRATILVETLWNYSFLTVGQRSLRGISGLGFDATWTLESLQSLGTDGIPALILALEDPDDQMRLNAAQVLMDLGSGLTVGSKLDCRSALPALMRTVSDPNPEVRVRAVGALEKCREFPMTLIEDPTFVR